MYITDLQSATSISSGGNDKLPTKTTLQSTTAVLQLHVSVTPGAGTALNSGRGQLRAYLVVSPFDLTAANAVKVFGNQRETIELRLNQENGVPIVDATDLIPVAGLYAYVWFEYPDLSPAASLSAKLVEIN